MFIYKIFFLIFLTGVFTSGAAHGQDANQNPQVNIITGKVVSTDVDGNSIIVKIGNENQLFYVEAESELYQGTHHITSIEILIGDPVKIKYDNSSGKNIILKLLDTKPAND